MNHSNYFKNWINTSRVRLTLLFGGLSVLMALAVIIFLGHSRTKELEDINSKKMLLIGRPIVAALAEGLREREREVILLSHHLRLAQGSIDSLDAQRNFDEVRQSFPYYSWIGVADIHGVVKESTGGLLKGVNVSQRPWFSNGLKKPFTGDAHEALLLDKYLRTDPNAEPLRFLDFVSPVRSSEGDVVGVLAVHMNWVWVIDVIKKSLSNIPGTENMDVLIINRAGEFLYPKNLPLEKRLNAVLPSSGNISEMVWIDDGNYLTTTFLVPDSINGNLGWTIVFRQPMSDALAPIRRLYKFLIFGSIVFVFVLMAMTYWAAGRFSAPIEQLEREARRIDEKGQGANFDIDVNVVEFLGLRDSLHRMTQHLLEKTNELQQSNLELEKKVSDRTAELIMQKQQFEGILEDQTEIICRFNADHTLTYVNPAYCRVFGLKSENVVGAVWAPSVHPEDLERVKSGFAKISVENPIIQIENRVISGDGDIRWFHFVNRAYFDEAGRVREWQAVGRDITKKKILAEEIRKVSDELQDLYDHAPCGYYSVDDNGIIIKINDMALRWMGDIRSNVVNKSRLADYLDDKGREQYLAQIPVFRSKGKIGPMEFNLIGKDGRMRRINLSATAVLGNDGKFLRSRSIMFDMTDLHEMRQRLGQLNTEQEAMLDNDLLGIARLKDRKIIWRNKAMERIFAYTPGELLGVDTSCMYPTREAYEEFGAQAYPILKAGKNFRKQVHMQRKDGTKIWLDISGVNLSDESGESLWLLQDISEMKQYQAQVEHLAFHDSLTNLPNRAMLSEDLRVSMALNDRQGTLSAICYIDLNGFKPINDHLGHDAGDEVLVEVAKRMQAAVRESDTVARLGGDEFSLLLTNLNHQSEVNFIIERLNSLVEEEIVLKSGESVFISASVGVAIYPVDANDSVELFAIADREMYKNKKNRKN